MSTRKETRVAELLDQMAERLVNAEHHQPFVTIGQLMYLVWEARKALKLPDIDGLKPL